MRLRSSTVWRVRLLTVGLVVTAVASFGAVPLATVPFVAGRWSWIGFVGLTLLFAVSEVFSVHLHFSRNSHSFSLFEIPLTLGLFFVPGMALVGAHALGSGVALAVHRRQRPVKLLFNLASFVLADQAAIVVFRAASGASGGFSARSTLGAAAGALTASMLSALMVIAVISVAEGSWRDRRLVSSLAFGSASALVSTSLGLIAVEVLCAHPESAWLLLVPTAGLYVANHAYTRERRRHQGLEFLHDSTQLLHQSPEVETALVELVGHARDAFRAGFAQLVYLPPEADYSMDVTAERDTVTTSSRPLQDSGAPTLLALANAVEGPQILERSTSPSPAIAYLDRHRLSDAVLTPLRSEQRACGLLVIGNRHGDVARFDRDDLVLLATLAASIAGALENGRLEQSLDQLRELERRLTYQATHDGLTELANRMLFTQHVTSALDTAPTTGATVGVLFLDLDDFKTVNDSMGHAAGDELLIVLGRRLHSAVPASATAARLGGDEFAIVVPMVTDPTDLAALAERLLAAVAAPVAIMGHQVPVRASIGIAWSAPGDTAADVLRNADTAMYAAKGRGKNCIAVFEPAFHTAAVHRYNLTYELDRAIRDNEFVVYYQPIVRLADNAIVGAEGLVRWQHPALGLLAPGAFIPIAEESGAIVHIGRAVLDQVCEYLADFDPVGTDGRPLYITVNLSARDLLEPTLATDLSRIVQRHRIDHQQLVFEITEGLLISEPDIAIRTLTNLKQLGVRIALDDFGTGYSSLSQLRRLPVDILKIAQPFTDDLHQPDGLTFVQAIIGLARTLQLTIVAEGVEHADQADVLTGLGCHLGQGYRFAPPLPREAFTEFLAAGVHHSSP